MLSTISWTQYITSLFIITACYYAVIVTLFYRQRLWTLLNGTTVATKEKDPHLALQQALQVFFARAASHTRPREEYLQGLRSILRNYPTIKGTPVQHTMNAYIQSTCAEQLGLALPEAEVKLLWD
ncbi:MAG: hypothetical protein JNJ86_15505 [Chitinophagaceae bacterium]|nr:hypothetical protein [Chitinophagaceae bacterium]